MNRKTFIYSNLKWLQFVLVLFSILLMSGTCLNRHSMNLENMGRYNLKIPEPSGLAIDSSRQVLYIISDQNKTIYKTDLEGNILSEIKGGIADSEGIALSPSNEFIYVLGESKRKIKKIDLSGNKIKDIDIPGKSNKNSGPEGLDYDVSNGHFYIVNEKDPSQLIVMDSIGQILQREDVNVLSDLSAIAYDASQHQIWVVSDMDRTIIRADSNLAILEKYAIDIEKMEGMAIDFEKKLIYLVSDKESELHVFRFK